MSTRMELTNFYQCHGERPKPYNVFLSSPKTSFFAPGSPEGGFIMVVPSDGNLVLQKALLQSPCLRRRKFSVAMEMMRWREEYCRTGAYFSLFDQRRLLRFPRTTMRDLARSGAMFLSLLMVMTHIEVIALGKPLGRRRRRKYFWTEISTYVSFSRRISFSL